MKAVQAVELLDRIGGVVTTVWVGGGWGVDALIGRDTRPHADLDLMIDAESLGAALDLLTADGFVLETDWLPVRAEVAHPDGRRVDLHPVRFAPDGSGVQAGLNGTEFRYPIGCSTAGVIGGRPVTCLSVAQQLLFHSGYEHRPVDRHDLALLDALAG